MMMGLLRKRTTRSTSAASKSRNGGGAPVHPTPTDSDGAWPSHLLSPSASSCPCTAAAAREDVGREPSGHGLEDSSSGSGRGGTADSKCCYRTQLEEEILDLQSRLEEELTLRAVLANAIGDEPALGLPSCHYNNGTAVPNKAQQLLSSVKELEDRVSELEDELVSLHCLLRQERSERHLAEHRFEHPPSLTRDTVSRLCSSSNYSWDEQISSLRLSKYGQDPQALQAGSFVVRHKACERSQGQPVKLESQLSEEEPEGSIPSSKQTDGGGLSVRDTYPDHDMIFEETHSGLVTPPTNEDKVIGCVQPQFPVCDDSGGVSFHPNSLSEEMVHCMRNIFLCLSGSSKACYTRDDSPDDVYCPSPSPIGHLSSSSTSFSELFSSNGLSQLRENTASQGKFDPYGVQVQGHQTCIGVYSLAAEVSWMTVGKKQLKYAAEALRRFRYLVEQLAKVDPSCLNPSERLAFWINLYNALIMHAYLAYGVPRNDLKHFSLMQKASYTVGRQSFSAAEIEYVILKMKSPTYRPQTALILTLHKFKITEEHLKYSVDVPEPLAVFALSCGMYSSPAVKIYTAENIKKQLQLSLRDYVRASVSINDKGKLLVPKLLHCFAKSMVEDSLLVDWICRFLLPDQVSLVRDTASQWRHRLLGARSFTVIPFISRFRYLFLPDKNFSVHL